MTARFMLDTPICIDLMKNQPPEVAQRFAQCDVGYGVISAISMAELEFGVACSGDAQARNQAALEAFVQDIIPVAAFDSRAAQACGPVRLAVRDCKRDALDKLIAAHAVALNVVLVTNNEADFAGYPGLKLDNWISRN